MNDVNGALAPAPFCKPLENMQGAKSARPTSFQNGCANTLKSLAVFQGAGTRKKGAGIGVLFSPPPFTGRAG